MRLTGPERDEEAVQVVDRSRPRDANAFTLRENAWILVGSLWNAPKDASKDKNRRGSTAGLDQLRASVGRRVTRSATIACRSMRMSRSTIITRRARERNRRIAGIAPRSGTVEERAEALAGEAQQLSAKGRSCCGFWVQPHGKFDRRSRREAPLYRACVVRQCAERAKWLHPVHSRYGLRGVRVGKASLQGPGSRYFALTEMDTDVEDEDSDSLVLEAPPAETRLVILGAQTQADLADPTALDEDSDEGSDHHSPDTESIDSRGGTSDTEGEVEVVPPPEPLVPSVAVLVERFVGSSQWLAEVDLEVVFEHRPCLMKSVPGLMKEAYRSAMRVAFTEIVQGRSESDAGVGSSFSYSLDSCCTSPAEVVWCQKSSRSTDSRCSQRKIGHLC